MNLRASVFGWIGLMTWGCTCNDCDIRKNEPMMSIQFYSSQTMAELSVNLESINGIPPSEIEIIEEGYRSQFNFPLSLNQDSSTFVINSFKSGNDSLMTDTLAFTYILQPFQTEKDFVEFKADSMELKYHTYDSASFICPNPDCTNAEVLLRLFY